MRCDVTVTSFDYSTCSQFEISPDEKGGMTRKPNQTHSNQTTGAQAQENVRSVQVTDPKPRRYADHLQNYSQHPLHSPSADYL